MLWYGHLNGWGIIPLVLLLFIQFLPKVRQMAKISKRCNQVPHLTQDVTWESNKNTINITNNSQPFLIDISTMPLEDTSYCQAGY